MDINEEIARRRAEAARSARLAKAGRQAQLNREQARQAALQPELMALAKKFVRWANQSGIEPTALDWHQEKKLFGGYRFVPRKDSRYGWTLAQQSTVHNCTDGFCHHATSVSLIVFTTEEIGWTRSSLIVPPRLTPQYAESRIVDFIMESGSTIPWPG